MDQIDDECVAQPIDIAIYWKSLLVVLYSFVGLTSLIGNCLVVLIVALRKEMRTVTNIFISSVSAANLVITGGSLWASPLAYYQQSWFLGEAMCYVVMTIQGASMMWVPFTLTAIAIDRYRLVSSPFRRQMSVRTCIFVIAAIWIAAFAVLSPMLANVRFIEIPCHNFCLEDWRPHNHLRLLYGVSVLVIRSGLPLLIISYCNWKIALILSKQGNKFHRLSINSSEIGRKQRLHVLLKAMVLIFAISSCPLDMFNVLQDLEMVSRIRLVPEGTHQLIFFSCHWVAMAGNLLNPLVYAWWNENFRREIKAIANELASSTGAKGNFYNVIVSVRPVQSERSSVAAVVKGEKAKGGPEAESFDESAGDVQI